MEPSDEYAVAPKFEGNDDYPHHVWAAIMKVSLERRGLWDLVSGNDPEPPIENEIAHREWEVRTAKATLMFFANVSDNIMSANLGYTPQRIWENIRTIYQHPTWLLIETITREKGQEESVEDHIRRFEVAYRELCKRGYPIDDYTASTLLFRSLPNLNAPAMEGLRVSAAVNKTPFIEVCQRIRSELRRQKHQESMDKERNPPVECGYCGKWGHTANVCRRRKRRARRRRFRTQ
jgi:gag-polypeptide of LTR copia-type